MSFPRYPEYRDSGVEWLGEIPAHWEVKPLKRIASLRSGDSITSEHIEESGLYPVIGGNGVRGYTSSYTHEGDYAVIGRQGALCGNVNYASGRFWASEHAVVATPVITLNTTWLGETLRAMNLNQYSVSAAQPGLSVDAIGRLRIAIPPLNEQHAIARFLAGEIDAIGRLAAEQHRLIELLKEKRQAAISHAVTKGLDPAAPMKPSGIEWLGDVPFGWKIVRLADVFRESNTPGQDDLPVLSVSIHDGVSDREISDDEMDRSVNRSEDRTRYKRVQPEDLVYNMMRAWQGGFGTVTVDGMVSPAYVVAMPLPGVVTAFVEHLLRTSNAIEEMRRRSKGVTDFRLRLYWEEFKNIRIALPPPDEADAICAHIRAFDAAFAALAGTSERAIDLLNERRAALISAAVTGKIDVRHHAGAGDAA